MIRFFGAITLPILFFAISNLASSEAKTSIVMTMICRDEEVNLRANLAQWFTIIDFFIFLIDSRTKDNTLKVIDRIFAGSKANSFKAITYEFEGFGQARTSSLAAAWEHFPQASHVVIADPDWRPDITTMKKSDLDLTADVFRFLSYDRNNITTRRMDWILRHKPGLKMRYHLHEVLDNGVYAIKSIPWVIHEIEKPGSWHSTVGHGHSMSAKRYEFDLDLLHKDLALYGHDPHTHYYLGVSYEAFAKESLKQLSPQQINQLPKHVNTSISEAIKYLKLRALSTYEVEFVEERWSVMYLLGATFITFPGWVDMTKAIYWLSMCRDFNKQQSECALALVRVYMAQGDFELAWDEMEAILKTEQKDREMLNHYKMTQCTIPAVVIEVFDGKWKMKPNAFTANDAKYILLMHHMTKHQSCIGESVARIPSELLSRMEVSMHSTTEKANLLTISENAICTDSAFQAYMMDRKYLLHPCKEIAQAVHNSKVCSIFRDNCPPAYEDLQAATAAKSFVGAAIPADIIHHIYAGDTQKIFSDSVTYKVLFAEYFSPAMVYSFIGNMENLGFKNYEITIVTPFEGLKKQIAESIRSCTGYYQFKFTAKINYMIQSLEEFGSNLSNSKRFDYIEYNGGLSKSVSYAQHLRIMKSMLTSKGVIGVTYFTDNKHVHATRHLLSNRNHSAHLPFSVDPAYLLEGYLDLNGLSGFKNDLELLTLLGGEVYPGSSPPLRISDLQLPPTEWKVFGRSEVERVIHQAGLKVVSRLPTAYASPFDEIDNYDVQKYQAHGMTADTFAAYYLINFRNTLYIVDDQVDMDCELGRPKLTRSTFSGDMADKIHVFDRIGSLGASFSNVLNLAKEGIPVSFGFSHYSNSKKFAVRYTADPRVALSLTMLSNTFSLRQLHNSNKDFTRRNFPTDPANTAEEILIDLLIHMLAYLERLNVITFWSKAGCINKKIADAPKRKGEIEFTSSRKTETKTAGSIGGSRAAKVGGLTVGFNTKPKSTPEKVVEEESPLKERRQANVPKQLQPETVNPPIRQKPSSTVRIKDVPSTGNEEVLQLGGLRLDMSGPTKEIFIDLTADEPKVTTNSDTEKAANEVPPIKQKNSSNKKNLAHLSPEHAKKVERMRSLGFSDDVIFDSLSNFGDGDEDIEDDVRVDDNEDIRRTMAKEEVVVPTIPEEDRYHHSATPKNPDTVVVQKKKKYEGPNKNTVDVVDSEATAVIKDKLVEFLTMLKEEKIVKKKAGNSYSTSASERATTAAQSLLNSLSSPSVKPDADDVKKKLNAIVDLLSSESDQKSREFTKTPADLSVNSNKPDSRPTENLKVLSTGGLKLKNSAKSDVVGDSSKTQQSPGVVHKQAEVFDLNILDAQSISLPKRQTLSQLQYSFRSADCFLSDSKSPNCTQPLPVKRRTAYLWISSLTKLTFDSAQLRLLADTGLVSRGHYDLIENSLSSLLRFLQNLEGYDGRAVRLIYREIVNYSPVLNRAFRIQPASNLPYSSLTHMGALKQLRSISSELTKNDFIVVDVILQPTALKKMNEFLMLSTVWFDSTNGVAVVSHHDDGLVDDSFAHLAQQLGWALSVDGLQYRVVKYYAIAMTLGQKASISPVSMSKKDELTIILWLNSSPDDNGAGSQQDGIYIYDDYSAGKLFTQGVSVYPAVHPDFLSKSGDLFIDIMTRCKGASSELVPMQSNRMVVIKERKPFVFVSQQDPSHPTPNEDFKNSHMNAFIVVLSSST